MAKVWLMTKPKKPDHPKVQSIGATLQRAVEQVADQADDQREHDHERRQRHAGQQLGQHDPHPARLEGERRHRGALAPLAGHQHDADDREQDRRDEGRRRDEVAERRRLVAWVDRDRQEDRLREQRQPDRDRRSASDRPGCRRSCGARRRTAGRTGCPASPRRRRWWPGCSFDLRSVDPPHARRPAAARARSGPRSAGGPSPCRRSCRRSEPFWSLLKSIHGWRLSNQSIRAAPIANRVGSTNE